MEQSFERITTLRRSIEKKRESLGLSNDILTLRRLRKFRDLSGLKIPYSKYWYKSKDVSQRFDNTSYINRNNTADHIHIFTKITDIIAEHSAAVLTTKISGLTVSEAVEIANNYFLEEVGLSEAVSVADSSDLKFHLANEVLESKANKKSDYIVELTATFNTSSCTTYTPLNTTLPKKAIGQFKATRNNKRVVARLKDIHSIVAQQLILQVTAGYLFDIPNNLEVVRNKLTSLAIFDQAEFEKLTKTSFLSFYEENSGNLPLFIKSIIILTFEEMLRQVNALENYEKRTQSLNSDYAKTYMTKKNIPAKHQEFMEKNHFLKMFGFVELDAACKLETIQKLSKEFITLSNQMFLPVAKENSLRFKRLGHLKAAGVYYPSFKTLAVDLDSPHSFIHELFHLIDFENDLLSFNKEFQPLLEKYRVLTDEAVTDAGADSKFYYTWYKSSSKYNREYYHSNEEAFARMGELYISEQLHIRSSFGKEDYSTKNRPFVYPMDDTLLQDIKTYYDELFETLKNSREQVIFQTSIIPMNSSEQNIKEENSSTFKEITEPYELYRVTEQLSLNI